MSVRFREALVLSPHTDDAITGAGVLMYKLVQHGCRVLYRVFCTCDDTLEGTGYPKGTIAREDIAAASVLGVEDIVQYDFENKHLGNSRQEILDIIYGYRKNEKLDLVIAPYVGDFHQDHQTVAEEALRASTRHPVTILQYPVIGTSKDFNPNLYIPVSHEEADLKIKAISCYETQLKFRGNWFNLENFWAEMRSRGVYINARFAEAFILVKGTLNIDQTRDNGRHRLARRSQSEG